MMPPLKKLPLLLRLREVEAFSFGDLLASSAESAAKEKEKTESDYVNTDHLLSSASIVECL